MLKKRTKIIILASMVLLLGVTGYLNIALNNRVVDAGTSNITAYNYFDSYRSDRASTREEMIASYEAIINSENSSEEDIENAKQAKLSLVEKMEEDLALEYSIKSLGYQDAIVTSSTNYINIIVKSAELTENQVSQIVAMITDQTDYNFNTIKVIPIA